MITRAQLEAARTALPALALASGDQRAEALKRMADALEAAVPSILDANALDVEAAQGVISPVMVDRLLLTDSRVRAMAAGVREVAALPDPTGRVLRRAERPNGLVIERVSVPMGVIAIIYESRPNVTSDAAALCIRAGSAAMLRCGKEAHRSAAAITQALRRGLAEAGLPADCVQLVEDTSRESARELMHAEGLVDLLIPRGGAGLIRACVEEATVPVIQTGTGICHIYVDRAADIGMALKIVNNAKTSRPSVCNAAECCLVHRDIAPAFLPRLRQLLTADREAQGLQPVELRLDEGAAAFIPGTPAGEKDFDTEFLDYILAVRVVDSLSEAVRHIALHSTHHSEAIVTGDSEAAEAFVHQVDSAAVYVNASTRFTDGGEFGLGCEMGISTQRLHARGPLGLEELCTYKYVVRGDGQVR
ncbi:MAG: glutamate-5-semialdehyde dehydrogenase [Clostridia bacterium]|nr:glutamate-5-semialdehyde dehydrogenase [Clostridia bacterium]